MSVATQCKFEYRCSRCFHSLYAPVEESGTEQPCRFCGVQNLLPEATPDRIARAENVTEEAPVAVAPNEIPLMFRDEQLTDEELQCEVKRQMYVAPGDMICMSTMAASRVKRFLGALIDGALAAVAFALGIGLMIGLVAGGFISQQQLEASTFNLDQLNALAATYFPFVALALFQWNLIATRGQSIGKKLLGMKIVTDGGHAPGFIFGVVLRNWVRVALSIIPFFSLIDVLFIFGESHRCIHDYLAGTFVVDV